MNAEIITYFFIFLLGVAFVLPACYLLVLHFDNKQYSFFKKLKWTALLLLGLLLLWMTLPSFTEMMFPRLSGIRRRVFFKSRLTQKEQPSNHVNGNKQHVLLP